MRVHVPDDAVPPVAPGRQVGHARGEHLVDHAEVVEDLQAAWLQAFAARPGEVLGRLVDEAIPHAPPGQVAGERQAGRADPTMSTSGSVWWSMSASYARPLPALGARVPAWRSLVAPVAGRAIA